MNGLSGDPLLLLFLPLAIHDADLEVLTPFGLGDVSLTVGTFLNTKGLLIVARSLPLVVLDDLHVWIQGSRDLLGLLLL